MEESRIVKVLKILCALIVIVGYVLIAIMLGIILFKGAFIW